MKNNTPRVQNVINDISDSGGKNMQPLFDLSRMLERELNAFKSNNLELIEKYQGTLAEIETLRAEVDMWSSRCAAAIWMLPEIVTGGQLREAQDKFVRERIKNEQRIVKLETALADAISTYGPADQVLVTAERIEAWQAALAAKESS
jgi:hypothetical protein